MAARRTLMRDVRLPGGELIERLADGAGEGVIVGELDKTGVHQDQVAVVPWTYSLVVVLDGRGTYVDARGGRHAIAAGWAFERVPGRRQSTLLDASRPWRERFVAFGPHLSVALIGAGVIDPAAGPAWRAPRDAPERLLALQRRVAAAGPGAMAGLIAEAIALVVALRPAAPAAADDAVMALRRWLEDDPLGRRDLAAWCARNGAEPDRLRKAFTRRFGTSPTAFRLARRMERACTLLSHGGCTVGEVARALGYADDAAFVTQFRRRFGRTPARWRAGR